MSLRDDVWRAIDARGDELLELCAACIRVPAPNPPGRTTAIAELVRSALERDGIASDVFEPLDGAPNVVARLGRARGGPNLVLNCHLDTFPPAAGRWAHGDPYSGAIDDGRVYGSGAADMRASVGVALFLASLLKPFEDRYSGRVTFAFVSDEETGGRWGSGWLLEHVADVRGDACLIGDQCGTAFAGVAEKGICFLSVATTGSRSHAAYGNDDSATHRLLRVLTAIRGLEDADGDLAGRVTVNVGFLEGGGSPNLVAERASAKLDLRLPPGLSSARLLEAVDAVVAKTGDECEIAIDVLTEPSATPPDAPIVSSVLEASRLARGEAAEPITRIGASDARLFRGAGIPTVVYGPGPNNMGAVDEFVTGEEVVTTAKVHAAVMLSFLEDAA